MPKFYVLMHETCDMYTAMDLFWTRENTWVSLANASVFSEEETHTLEMPEESLDWVELPRVLWDEFQAYQYEADAKAAATEEDILF